MAYNQYYANLRAAVGRPPTPSTPIGGNKITFQIFDVVVSDTLIFGKCSRTLAEKARDIPLVATPSPTSTTVTMFGVTQDGRSVCCHVFGFRPACHVRFTTREGLNAVERWLKTGRRTQFEYRSVMEQKFNFAGFKWDPETRQRIKNNYLRISCTTVAGYDNLRWIESNLPGHDLEVVEHAGVPLYTKFYDETQLTPFQWITVTASDIVDDVVSTCDIEMKCNMGDWVGEPTLTVPAPYLFASCDIEAYSAKGEFPNKINSDDHAFMVGVVFQRFGSTLCVNDPKGSAETLNVSFVVDDHMENASDVYKCMEGADGIIHVLRYPNERAMLEGWRDCLCVWLDVDVVMWYNGFRFDLDYMSYRVIGKTPCPIACKVDPQYPEIGSRFFQFSKFVRRCTPVKMKQITSSAMGDNELCVWGEEYGRVTMDLYDIVCKREKMSSYSLDNVCRQVLKVSGGTVTWHRNSTLVTGSNTQFTKLKAGDYVQLAEEFYVIGDVGSDTELNLATVPIDIDKDVVDFPMTGQITKIDLNYKRMHEIYSQRGQVDDNVWMVRFDQIIDYCCRDCVAPLKLLWKLRYFLNDFQMCQITFTPFQQLLSRGQGIKGLNQVIRFAHQKDFLLNQFTDMQQVDYQGATVVDPTKGFHTNPIATLDFASLYPSIMISRHLCWTTVVDDPQYDNLPGVEYYEIPISEGLSYKFANNVDTVCPELLKALLAARKATKKEMFAENDPDMKALLNAKQLALKVSCNSVYGLTGAKTGLLKCVAIAASTTAYGRQTLERTKQLAMEHLDNVEIIYGDSVTPDTPILCRVTDCNGLQQIVYRNIEDIGDGNWIQRGSKEECSPLPCYEVWTDKGFTPIKRVIRHACGKPLKRIVTHTGVVDVTTDHSLLTPRGSKVTPTEVQVGEELLHADLPVPYEDHACDIGGDQAFAWGLFFAEGECGRFRLTGSSWAICIPNEFNFERALKGLRASEPDVTWVTKTSPVYQLYAVGDIDDLVDRWRDKFYTKYGYKTIPDAILNAPLNIRQSFWDGWCAVKADTQQLWSSGSGKIGSAQLYYLASTLGLPLSIESVTSGVYNFTHSPREWPCKIQNIVDLPEYTEYVYDLETENHHFAAGVGRMIVHNTDSIMIKFHNLPGTREGIDKAWELGEEASDWITEKLANNVVLECEKIYCPYLLLAKKCYAAKKYEGECGKLPEHPCRDVKGLELAKRDTSKFIRQAQSRIINVLLDTADRSAALTLVTQMIENVCMLHVPLQDYVTSKSLRKDYKSDKVMQQEVNRRRQQRSPGSEYKPGERVPMIAVERRGKGAPLLTERDSACEIMDDPEYVAEQGWRPNRRYYLTELHRKVTRVLVDDKSRVDNMLKVAFDYMESLKYNSIFPFGLKKKLERCVILPDSKRVKC